MPDQVYIEGQGLVNLTSEEQTAFDARRASDAAWRTEALRAERNKRLAETDWIVIKEKEEGGTVSNFADWKTYRQVLRDITDSATSLDDVTWPTKPE